MTGTLRGKAHERWLTLGELEEQIRVARAAGAPDDTEVTVQLTNPIEQTIVGLRAGKLEYSVYGSALPNGGALKLLELWVEDMPLPYDRPACSTEGRMSKAQKTMIDYTKETPRTGPFKPWQRDDRVPVIPHRPYGYFEGMTATFYSKPFVDSLIAGLVQDEKCLSAWKKEMERTRPDDDDFGGRIRQDFLDALTWARESPHPKLLIALMELYTLMPSAIQYAIEPRDVCEIVSASVYHRHLPPVFDWSARNEHVAAMRTAREKMRAKKSASTPRRAA